MMIGFEMPWVMTVRHRSEQFEVLEWLKKKINIEIEVPREFDQSPDDEEDEDDAISKDDAWADLGLSKFSPDAEPGNASA